jgi:hypothetical protein
MAPDQLRALLRRQPFRPFRLIMSKGNTYDVVSPEWMMVTATTTVVGIPGESGDGELVNLLDNFQISDVQPIDAEPVH